MENKNARSFVRRIVQDSQSVFRIQPGLWALKDCREKVLEKFKINEGNRESEEQFSHGYYQGLLVEIGKFRKRMTYIPSQDKNRMFLDKHLGEVADTYTLPLFTYDSLLRKARTVDVIWFNERQMPSDFYEVEHTTDIRTHYPNFTNYKTFSLNSISSQTSVARKNSTIKSAFLCITA